VLPKGSLTLGGFAFGRARTAWAGGETNHKILGLPGLVNLYLVFWDASNYGKIALRYDGAVRWLIDGYNLIRRSPELASREQQESLEAGRRALCHLLARTAQASEDQFTVVFDGAGAGGSGGAAPRVRVIFSSARESADRVLVRMAAQGGGAVVSNDREVRREAARAGAIAITADEFLTRLEAASETGAGPDHFAGKDEREDRSGRAKKGNPRRLGKKARAAARALARLRRSG